MVVINYTSLETSLTAVARAKSFKENTPSEDTRVGDDALATLLGEAWPQTGNLKLEDVSVDYGSGAEGERGQLALRNVSIDIASGQKVAICGRSGSGKSTLLAALTRMVELSSGFIHVDGVDVANIHPSEVRTALNSIPQEPLLFYKTAAMNLDPSGELPDDVLASALEKVEFWNVVDSHGGLHSKSNLDNFSLGQKQLLALARAILKPGRIVFMDEATSS